MIAIFERTLPGYEMGPLKPDMAGFKLRFLHGADFDNYFNVTVQEGHYFILPTTGDILKEGKTEGDGTIYCAIRTLGFRIPAGSGAPVSGSPHYQLLYLTPEGLPCFPSPPIPMPASGTNPHGP